jgi:hypothetical protein
MIGIEEGTFEMTTSDPHDYLDTPAAKLKVEYPHRHAFISDLVTKYKKTLRDGLLHIGRTPEEVIESFEKDVRKHCLRTKAAPKGRPRKTSRK